jgi:hypothetical protein
MFARHQFICRASIFVLCLLNSHTGKMPAVFKGIGAMVELSGGQVWRLELKSPQPSRDLVPKKPLVADHYKMVNPTFPALGMTAWGQASTCLTGKS